MKDNNLRDNIVLSVIRFAVAYILIFFFLFIFGISWSDLDAFQKTVIGFLIFTYSDNS